jgi:hypothetical protein
VQNAAPQHEVARLIDDFRRANPEWRSFTDLARRAGEHGTPMTRQNFYRLYSQPIRSFTRDHVIALSAALRMPIESVVRAFLRSMDLPTLEFGQVGIEAAIKADTRLSADHKRILSGVVAAMRQNGG